eukprot:scaffold2299_cov156-Chaetoceros_neogracile.AAC.1
MESSTATDPTTETPKPEETSVTTTSTAANVNILNHAHRRVIIYNIDKFMKAKHLDKLIKSWTKDTNIIVSKTKKPPKNNWCVLTLDDEQMVDTLIAIVNDGTQKNKKGGMLRAQRPADGEDGDGKRSRDGDGDGDGGDKNNRANKRQRMSREQIECVKTDDEVRNKLTPLWEKSYEQQLDLKRKMMVNKCFQRITSEIKKKFQVLHKEMKKQNGASQKTVDPLYAWLKERSPIQNSKILGAPRKIEYRNKCELTFGYRHSHELDANGQPMPIKVDASTEAETDTNTSEDGKTEEKMKIVKTPAVGFMAGGWSGGVSNPHCLSNIPDVVCGIADVINTFLDTSSVPPYNAREHRGIWRTVTIRSSERTKQCMVIIVHAPASGGAGRREDGSDDYSAAFEGEKERLVKMLTEKISKPTRTYPGCSEEKAKPGENEFCDIAITSLFFQEFEGLSNPPPQHPVQHLYGNKIIEEKLLQCEFQISPGAFFQVTTEGAEQLYRVVVDKVKEVASTPKDTLLFDICCGTGTIGLTCMKEGAVGKVVGIDIAEPAIKDAIMNATRNGYSDSDGSTRFVASRAEVAMKKEVQNVARGTPLVAVVDPARDGLHQDVIKALRNEFSLQRIVYVSCNPTGSLVKDAALLCSPCTKKYRGLPFKITSAQPVDMFPHTDHCEMVMVFDRMTQEECDGEKKQVVIEAISEGLEEKSKDVEMKQEGEIEASVDIVNKESEDNAEVKPE